MQHREKRTAAGGQIERSGDVKARLRFKEDLLNPITVHFDAAGNLRIERRALRQRTDLPPKEFTPLSCQSAS